MGWTCSRHEWDEGSPNWDRVEPTIATLVDRAHDPEWEGERTFLCPACVAELLGRCEQAVRSFRTLWALDEGELTYSEVDELARALTPFRTWHENPEGALAKVIGSKLGEAGGDWECPACGFLNALEEQDCGGCDGNGMALGQTVRYGTRWREHNGLPPEETR